MSAPSPAVVGPVCEVLLSHDLPDLSPERRAVVVEFVRLRIGTLPTHMRLGVTAIGFAVEGIRRAFGHDRVVRLSRRPLPLIGEYFRLIRSLSYAYIWETWPTTTPDGGQP
jgi:hypothetical protein